MFCPACHGENPDDVAVCGNCGVEVSLAQPRVRIPQEEPQTSPSHRARLLKAQPQAEPAPPSSVTDHSRIGTTIGRRYVIQDFLGKGGMGIVYRAMDLELDEAVAIKLLQPEFTRELSEIERLKREIVTARKITHPNVIRLHDFGLDDDEGFISMEVLSGGSLADLLDKGPLPIPRGLDIAIGITEGLAAAHDKGIIHRDIKPENVLFDEDGTPKLVDFGLARTSTSANTVWAITGTPRYMSPEQTDGEKATPRSDVYSTGILLYYLFTGRLPFLGENILQLATQHAEEPPPRPRSLRSSIPEKVEKILLRCLEKKAEQRYPSSRALAAELRLFRDSGGMRDASSAGEDRTLIANAESTITQGGQATPLGLVRMGGLTDPAGMPRVGVLPAEQRGERTLPGSPMSAAAERPTVRNPLEDEYDGDGPTEMRTGPGRPAERRVETPFRRIPISQPDTDDHPTARRPADEPDDQMPPTDRTWIGPNPTTEKRPAAPPSRAKQQLATSMGWPGIAALGAVALLVAIAAYLLATRF